MNPATLIAVLNGDITSAPVAATPGVIEQHLLARVLGLLLVAETRRIPSLRCLRRLVNIPRKSQHQVN